MKFAKFQIRNGVLWFIGLGLFFNALAVFSSPAYREYRRLSHDLELRQDAFESKVKTDFVPLLHSAITNLSSVSLSPPHSYTSDGVLSRPPVNYGATPSSSPSGVSALPPRSVHLDRLRVFRAGCGPLLAELNGSYFRLGDFFLDGRIVNIFPFTVITDTGKVYTSQREAAAR